MSENSVVSVFLATPTKNPKAVWPQGSVCFQGRYSRERTLGPTPRKAQPESPQVRCHRLHARTKTPHAPATPPTLPDRRPRVKRVLAMPPPRAPSTRHAFTLTPSASHSNT